MPSSSLVSSGTVEGVTVGELLVVVALAAVTPCQLYAYGNIVDTYEIAVLRYQLAPACTYGII